eukprot:gnl/MRDRNA2_/MRDRNA2_107338_c0_seq1.p1 gnl/MRDRNA2_/MRDRNA2_107338_c0~~gnl/MRDRNA2_/MRDRNA2_107338_c0_seq1.p1  ORF type:complete len:401 (-),score=42.52 gnl/MRDRNA2_/MRDRNA2_107338_c0_seq1:686-1888(-)
MKVHVNCFNEGTKTASNQVNESLQGGFKLGSSSVNSEAIGVRQLKYNRKWNAVLFLRACFVIPAFVIGGVLLGRTVRHTEEILPQLGIVLLGIFCVVVLGQSIHWVTMWVAQKFPLTFALKSEAPVLRVYQRYSGMVKGPIETRLQCLNCRSEIENPSNGLVVYDASAVFLAMLAYDKKLRQSLADLRVLELGAGVGAVSLGMAQLGAKHVVATDIERNAVKAIQRNIKANKLEECCSAQCFAFGDEASHLCKAGKFDLIVSVDTVHFVNRYPELQDSMARSLVDCCAEEGKVFLVYESRGFVWTESELCRRLSEVFNVQELEIDGLHGNAEDEQSAWSQFIQHPQHEWIRKDSRLVEKVTDLRILLLTRRTIAMDSQACDSRGFWIGENEASPVAPATH